MQHHRPWLASPPQYLIGGYDTARVNTDPTALKLVDIVLPAWQIQWAL